jgi:hypothetical protein
MSRLVFQLSKVLIEDPAGNGARIYISLEEPNLFAPQVPFGCTGAEADFGALQNAALAPEAVRQAGRRLFDAVAVHEQLSQQLTIALQKQLPERCPVFVKIADPSGMESLPWEALCSPNGDFLGLDDRWSVGRMIAGRTPAALPWPFTPPLRVAAVLSCLGVPAEPEWRALSEALEADDPPVHLLVFVSEEQLYEELENLSNDESAPFLEVALVPSDLSELQERVAKFKPHVLHFFCHGSTGGGPHIELAVKADWALGAGQSSLTAEPDEIRAFTGPTDPPWLVVLNCCEGAAPAVTDDLHSLSLSLVYDGDVPAVVGMREPVASDDANWFTRVFYKKMVEDLARISAGNSEDSLDWTRFVVKARARLAEKYKAGRTLSATAASTKEWTLPALYVGSQPFVVHRRPPPHPTDRLKVELLEGLLARLPPDTPPDLVNEIEQQLAGLASVDGQ